LELIKSASELNYGSFNEPMSPEIFKDHFEKQKEVMGLFSYPL